MTCIVRNRSVFERFPKPVLQNGLGTKSVRSDKRFSHGNMQLLFLRREGGPLDKSELDNPKIARAELGQEVAAKRELISDTSNLWRCEVAQTKVVEDFGAVCVVGGCRKSSLQVARTND